MVNNWVNFCLHKMAANRNICKSLKGVTFLLTLYSVIDCRLLFVYMCMCVCMLIVTDIGYMENYYQQKPVQAVVFH